LKEKGMNFWSKTVRSIFSVCVKALFLPLFLSSLFYFSFSPSLLLFFFSFSLFLFSSLFSSLLFSRRTEDLKTEVMEKRNHQLVHHPFLLEQVS